MYCKLGMTCKIGDCDPSLVLKRLRVDELRMGREVLKRAVTFSTECIGNTSDILVPAVLRMTLTAMLFMSADEIGFLMSFVELGVRITDKEMACAFVAGDTFLIGSRSGCHVTAKRHNSVYRTSEWDMAQLAPVLKHLMRS